MSGTKYRAVIVGLSGIGALRSVDNPKLPVYGAMPRSHAASYHRHPQTELAAVCDLRQEALDAFYEQWKDVWPGVRLYTDYREMLEKEKPDLVSVVTPDHVHAELTVASAESGAKAILCEKPIATSLADADRMIAAAEKHGVLLSIEHSRRWAASYLQARELIRSGEIGPLRTVVCEMFSKRAMLFRNGTHLLDMICFFAESDPAWVMAELEEGFEHFTEYQGDGGHDPATDPSASAYIHFENGVRAFYNSSKVEFPGFQFYLTCEGGRVEISEREAKLVLGKSSTRWDVSTIPVERYMMERQLGAVGELIHVLENGGELVSPGREARKTLELILGILKSHHAGNRRVDFPLEG